MANIFAVLRPLERRAQVVLDRRASESELQLYVLVDARRTAEPLMVTRLTEEGDPFRDGVELGVERGPPGRPALDVAKDGHDAAARLGRWQRWLGR